MLKHVHQICHVILHFFWLDPSAANKSSHLRLYSLLNTLCQEQNLSMIHFIFIHPLFLQFSRCSLVMLPPCCCYYLKCFFFQLLSILSRCCTRRLRKGFLSANYSKPLAGCCCHTLVSSVCTTRSLGGHTRGFRYHNCWLESQFPLVPFLRAAASHSIYRCRPFLLSREAINCLPLRVPGNCAIGPNKCIDKVVL